MQWKQKLQLNLAFVFLIGTALLYPVSCSTDHQFNGTVLTSKQSARNFVLTNQLGLKVKSTDYIGRPVLLTFLYTDCSDVCPITVAHIKSVSELLNSQRLKFNIVAVSLDPERDDVITAKNFSIRLGMDDFWEFLVGPRDSLELVWEDYYVKPVDTRRHSGQQIQAATNPKTVTSSLEQAFTEKYEILHSNPIYIVDKHGVPRVVFTPPINASEIAEDLKVFIE